MDSWQRLDRLGRGGSADVWRATDATGRVAALKIPHASSHLTPAARALLTSEHASLTELAHEHVVATFGIVECGGATALALELLPGGDLVALLGAHPRHWIAPALAIHAALAYLHRRGFVHRDVKARNVLFGADGRARLIDFASVLPRGARAAQRGTTAAHRAARRAPEGVVDETDDVYAFAVLLYELLAGRLPYGTEAPADVAVRRPVPAWPLGPDADPVAAALAGRVVEVLCAEVTGLSAFTDVLESVALAYR